MNKQKNSAVGEPSKATPLALPIGGRDTVSDMPYTFFILAQDRNDSTLCQFCEIVRAANAIITGWLYIAKCAIVTLLRDNRDAVGVGA